MAIGAGPSNGNRTRIPFDAIAAGLTANVAIGSGTPSPPVFGDFVSDSSTILLKGVTHIDNGFFS